MTRRQIAHLLQIAHRERSWREISKQDYSGLIPAGTLARIAKTDGEYIPEKWRAWLGLGKPKVKSHRPRRLAEMSINELRASFENRVAF